MSMVIVGDCNIRDVETLRAACERLGLSFSPGVRPNNPEAQIVQEWFGRVTFDLESGTYQRERYGREQVDLGVERLVNTYESLALRNHALELGCSITHEQLLEDGTIDMTIDAPDSVVEAMIA